MLRFERGRSRPAQEHLIFHFAARSRSATSLRNDPIIIKAEGKSWEDIDNSAESVES